MLISQPGSDYQLTRAPRHAIADISPAGHQTPASS